MPVNPITGIVTYTLDEWKEESQLWERNGALLERERLIELLEPFGECEPSICGKGCRGEYRCVGWAYRHAIRLIKGEKN